MNPYSFSGLLIAVTSFSLGLVVLINIPNKKLGFIWFLFTLATSGWGFGVMMIGFISNYQLALWIWRLSYIFGVIWISPLFYHFVCVFVGQKRPRSIVTHYLIAFLIAINIGSHSFFNRLQWVFDSFFYARAGWLYAVFFVWWLLLVSFSHFELLRIYQTVSDNKKNQIKYFFLATVIGYTGGVESFLPKFGVNIYPWGNFLVCLYPLIVSFAILRYNLMDIRIFIRRTGLLLSIYAALIILTIPILFFTIRHSFIGGVLPNHIIVGLVLFAGTILSIGPILYAFLVKQSSYFHEHTLASITHELKSPLAILENAFDHLSGHPGAERSAEDQDTYNDMITRNLTRLKDYTNQLLTVFKIEETSGKLILSIVPVKNLFKDILTVYGQQAQMKNLTLKFSVNPDDLMISCDREKIFQVLSNLVSNSLKFTESGSIEVSAKAAKKDVLFSVSDTGVGIAREDLPYVFDRFFKGNKAINTKGTGLGLTIAKAWVEAHRGRIWAESNNEVKGTTIKFQVTSTPPQH